MIIVGDTECVHVCYGRNTENVTTSETVMPQNT